MCDEIRKKILHITIPEKYSLPAVNHPHPPPSQKLKCPCHKMRVYIFETYDTKYTEIRKQNRNCFFSVKVIAV